MRKKIALAATIATLANVILLTRWIVAQYKDLTVELPSYEPIKRFARLDQQWTPQQREWFHHADQGTQTFDIPFEWFMALERRSVSWAATGLLSDPQYLDRYGFIPAAQIGEKSPLPVGFVRGGVISDADGRTQTNPATAKALSTLGLTCAACHTGRFTYGGATVLIEGAPALINLQNFQKAVGLSIIFARWLPGRFDRFANRILGPDASESARSQLHKQFDAVYKQVSMVHDLENGEKTQTIEEGFARLDALNRIGNTVFALDIDRHENFVAYSAPVHFPRNWDASWFEWVQYNGSIQRPMTRNAGEALGVRAVMNMSQSGKPNFRSTVQTATLFQIEQLLAGAKTPTSEHHFTGLASPKWPGTLLPPINPRLAATGASLYRRHCSGCHLPATSDPEFGQRLNGYQKMRRKNATST